MIAELSPELPRRKGLGTTVGFGAARRVAAFVDTAGIVSREYWLNTRRKKRKDAWHKFVEASLAAGISDRAAEEDRRQEVIAAPVTRAMSRNEPRRQFFA
jgi:hypothetical protein